jgi:hypothetical protein
MKNLFLMLAFGVGFGLASCGGVPPDGVPPGSEPTQLQSSALTATPAPVLTCPTGSHRSCYVGTGDCACCPLHKALDCFGPGDCYCCSGTTCM